MPNIINKAMKIIPLAADSMGTRSVATLVLTKNLRILVDPGVSLGPSRYNLPPHELELKAYTEQWKSVVKEAKNADILIISHYHFDHYNPFENLDIYTDKTVFIKHPTKDINLSQKKRAKDFLELIKDKPRKLEYADGLSFELKGASINFSKAVFHGAKNTPLGSVVMTSVHEGSGSFVHASDTGGPTFPETTDWIINERPDTVFLDGLATIFLGWREDPKLLETANKEEVRILNSKIKTVILDHHLVRDLYYKNKIKPVIELAKELNKKLVTSAEYLGVKPDFLEAKRRELWNSMPSSNLKALPKNIE
ncbi:Metallo-beta-lactamase superfamily protein [Candidatus Tiddalikarchaeum anstoanum]|nr:Metallo-beta-lactamase superfamily protein [Candidatus Tiddalikarchaeum anstoanum]